MSKIVLPPVTGANNLSTLNSNFSKIEEALNDRALYRDNPVGEPNQMVSELDMNGKRIYNLPRPILPSEPARLADIGTGGGGGGIAYADNVVINTIPGLSATQVQAALEEINAKPDNVFDPQSLRVPESTVAVLPNAATRANKVLGFNGSGVPVAIPLSADDASVLRLDLATPNETKGSDLVSFVNTFGGDRSVTDKLKDVLSVKDFGAIGDGVVNDTVAIQTALNYAQANNRSVFFPKGVYVASGLTYTATASAHVTISGEGSGNTLIQAPSGTNLPVFTLGVGGATLGPNQVLIEGISFKGNYPGTYQPVSTSYTSHAFLIQTANHILFDDCRFYNAVGGLTVQNGVITHIHRCGAWYNEIGYYVATPGLANAGTTTFLDKSDAKNNHRWGVYFDDGRMLTMSLCTVEGNGGNGTGSSGGVYVGEFTGSENGPNFNAVGAVIDNTWFEFNSGSGSIYFRSGSNTVRDCNFTNIPTESVILVDGGRYFLDRLRFENNKTYHVYEFDTVKVLAGNSITNCFVGGTASSPANVLYDPVKTTINFSSGGGSSPVVIGSNVGTGSGLLYRNVSDVPGTRTLNFKSLFASTGINLTNTADTVNIAVTPATVGTIGGVRPGSGLTVDGSGTLSVTGTGVGEWITASLAAGWSTYTTHTVRYRKEGDIIRLSGAMQYTSSTVNDVPAFTLPVGYRPTGAGFVALTAPGGGNTHASLIITDSTGVASVTATNAVVFLDGITFPIT